MAINISPTGQISSSYLPGITQPVSNPALSGYSLPQMTTPTTQKYSVVKTEGDTTTNDINTGYIPASFPTPDTSLTDAISNLTTNLTASQPKVTVPPLDYTPPSGQDITDQWNNFIKAATNDPNLVSYYTRALNLAQGNTDIATQFINQDYTTGVRQTNDTLSNSLAQLALTSNIEQKGLLDTLNKRGIALTQDVNGSLKYAGGGQSATEVGQLNDAQRLRQEAEQRTANQQIENMGITQQKGLVSAGQSLNEQKLALEKQQQQDISNKAQQSMNLYTAADQSKLTAAQIKQQQQIQGIGSSSTSTGDSRLTQLQKMSSQPGGLNPAQQTELKSLGG